MSYTMNTNKTEAQCRREIVTQLERWERDDGKYGDSIIGRYDFPVPETIGSTEATMRFELRGQNIVVACSSQNSYRQNLRCVGFAIEAMRMNEKRGIADTIRKAYLQIEAPKETRDPYEVLGVRPDASPALLDAAYKTQANVRHPDKGGSKEAMQELNDARDRIKEETG